MLLLTSSTFLTVAATQAKLPYDPLADFVPIAIVGEGPDAARGIVGIRVQDAGRSLRRRARSPAN